MSALPTKGQKEKRPAGTERAAPSELAAPEMIVMQATSAGTASTPARTEGIEGDTPIRHIYRWDLDKTYLDTDFRLHRIWRVPFESASNKRNIPGVVALLRELTRATPQHKDRRAQVVFISGSPRQMRASIEEKFRIDGLRPDHLHLKPNLENFVSLRWRAIREQVGYKLPLLLEARVSAPSAVNETCFGDDSESDAFVYSMYADLVSGRIGDFTLKEMMTAAGAYPDAILRARDARRKIKHHDAVEQIFIHLAMQTPPERYAPYGPRVIPIRDYFQAALCLFSSGHLSAGGVVSVAYDMVVRYHYSPRRLAHSFKDILKRGFFKREAGLALADAVAGMHFPAPLPSREQTVEMLKRLANVVPSDALPPPVPQFIDYPALIATLRKKVKQAEAAGIISDALERAVLDAATKLDAPVARVQERVLREVIEQDIDEEPLGE